MPSEQVPPRVTTMTFPLVGSDPVAVQLAPNEAVPGVTVGVVELVVKPAGKVTTNVFHGAALVRIPVLDVVNPHVHVEAALGTTDDGADETGVTAVTEVAVVMVADAVDAATVVPLLDVESEKFAGVTAPAAAVFFTTTVKVPVALVARAHEPVNVITMTLVCAGSEPVVVPVHVPLKPVLSVTAGVVVVVVKPDGKVATIVAPEASAPTVVDVLKLHVHVDAAKATSDDGAVCVASTKVTEVAAVMVALPALAAIVVPSTEVESLKLAIAMAPCVE